MVTALFALGIAVRQSLAVSVACFQYAVPFRSESRCGMVCRKRCISLTIDRLRSTRISLTALCDHCGRDDGKPGPVWPAYDRPVYRQGLESIRLR